MADLTFVPAPEALDLLAPSVAAAVAGLDPELARRIRVAAIDPAHADTAVFCEVHDWDPRTGANCLIVRGTRGERTSYAAVVVPAHTRADVNRTVRSLLDARKATFAPMDDAVELTGMEHGGITPIGLPEDWRVLVDSRVLEEPELRDRRGRPRCQGVPPRRGARCAASGGGGRGARARAGSSRRVGRSPFHSERSPESARRRSTARPGATGRISGLPRAQ
ncbi:YbaK/EbsC family protein [Salana multivorans]